MAGARFSIGIDLGTTNSVLAFVPLAGDAKPEILSVPQWESLAGLAEAPMGDILRSRATSDDPQGRNGADRSAA